MVAVARKHSSTRFRRRLRSALRNRTKPFYDADLGEPKGDYRARDGGFLMVFSRGCVAVNPTDKAVTLVLPQRYATLAGQEVSSLSLAPKRGAVLLAPAGRSVPAKK